MSIVFNSKKYQFTLLNFIGINNKMTLPVQMDVTYAYTYM